MVYLVFAFCGIKRYCKLLHGWFSVNTDGGYMRYDENGVIMRFSNFFEHGKCSFDMECAALVSGLEKVIKLGLDNIAILSDP
jgi:hypothetical protein